MVIRGCRQQGCCRQAYRDVFTASHGESCRLTNVLLSNHISDSLHAYKSATSKFSSSPVKIVPINSDQLDLPKNSSDNAIKDVAGRLEELISDELRIARYKRICLADKLPEGYHNLVLIAAAESARRRRWFVEMEHAASRCTNPALNLLWENWTRRWVHTDSTS